MRALQTYTWPGNVRELMGVVERLVITSFDAPLSLFETFNFDDEEIAQKIKSKKHLADVEKEHIYQILLQTGWRIEGPKGAAKLLGVHPSTLRHRMKKLGIKRPHLSK